MLEDFIDHLMNDNIVSCFQRFDTHSLNIRKQDSYMSVRIMVRDDLLENMIKQNNIRFKSLGYNLNFGGMVIIDGYTYATNMVTFENLYIKPVNIYVGSQYIPLGKYIIMRSKYINCAIIGDGQTPMPSVTYENCIFNET